MNYLKRPRTWVLIVVLVVFAVLAPRIWMRIVYEPRVYATADDIPGDPTPRVALVFGAGLARGRRPSPVLYDRVATAADLYRTGRVRKLLLSGDNSFVEYNEPEVMRATARSLGVPDEDIVLDYAGRRTYDSVYRARDIFEVTRAVVVTQAFHIDRALYLCDALGIDAVGVDADRRAYGDQAEAWWSLREVPATAVAVLDVHLLHPVPILGNKEPIDLPQ